MAAVTFLRTHVDAVLAVVLAAAYLVDAFVAERRFAGSPVVAGLETSESLAAIAATAFLLSLGVRTSTSLVPLGLALVALFLTGAAPLDASVPLAVGLVLAAYSVGAWTAGPAGLVGALGVGGLVGVAVIRQPLGPLEAEHIAVPLLLLAGPWALGVATRRVRLERGDRRLVGDADWEAAAYPGDSPLRDEIVREIRDVVERAMSVVILRSRAAAADLGHDPAAAREALALVDAAASDALGETQRLTGLLLSPDGTPLPELAPGLADIEELADGVTRSGLPVAVQVQGTPLPVTPDLDAVAYRVAYEALMSTLEHATASRANVVVRYERDEIQVEVTDDGVSTGEDDEDEETAGLLAVRDEVAALGGSLDAGPLRGGGYWVRARMPIEPDWT